MDIEKISETYNQFRGTAEQAFHLLDGVMEKMHAAAENGDTQAGEWLTQLEKVAETFQGGQGHVGDLLQHFHGIMSFLGQKKENDSKDENSNGSSDLISGFLKSDLGKTLESGAMEKIGSNLLSKLFK